MEFMQFHKMNNPHKRGHFVTLSLCQPIKVKEKAESIHFPILFIITSYILF